MAIIFIYRIAEVVEEEYEVFLKSDPDPFDDRHPGTYYNNSLTWFDALEKSDSSGFPNYLILHEIIFFCYRLLSFCSHICFIGA